MRCKSGAAAHGGLEPRRQAAGWGAVIDLGLPGIADAVGSDIEVLFDGGIRSGHDVLAGAGARRQSCLIGRSYIFGLGAGEKPASRRAIEIIRNELDVGMALTGVNTIGSIDRHILSD